MNIVTRAGLCVFLIFTASCSLAPLTPRVDAASIGKNEVKLQSNLGPTTSLGVLYGVGENLDAGLEFEQNGLWSAWSRYSFLNNPSGVSVAGNAGVFGSTTRDRRSNGWYAGLSISNQVTEKLRWSAGYRHALLDYEYGTDIDYWLRTLEFDNPDDGSVNGQLELAVSIRVLPHVEFSLGGVCQHLFKNTDPTRSDDECLPIIGFSFVRL